MKSVLAAASARRAARGRFITKRWIVRVAWLRFQSGVAIVICWILAGKQS